MKGLGTFRRAMSAVRALMNSTVRLPEAQSLSVAGMIPQAGEVAEASFTRKGKPRRRSKVTKGHTQPRKDWPVLFWAGYRAGSTCPKPLSRKKLKQICPNHPALQRGVNPMVFGK